MMFSPAAVAVTAGLAASLAPFFVSPLGFSRPVVAFYLDALGALDLVEGIELPPLLGTGEGYRYSRFPCPASPAHTVYVTAWVSRHAVVHHVSHHVDVQAA